MNRVEAVLVCLAIVAGAWTLMWLGWRRRGRKHDLPPLEPAPAVADSATAVLQAQARYLGTTTSGQWLDRVVARGLGVRSTARISLSPEGLDVTRPTGAFRVPAAALRGARRDMGIAGKVVPPHGVLVVTWEHGDLVLDTGFRLVDGGTPAHEEWVQALNHLVVSQEDHS